MTCCLAKLDIIDVDNPYQIVLRLNLFSDILLVSLSDQDPISLTNITQPVKYRAE